MSRASSTSDAFLAVASPHRRDILSFLALQERSVSEIVDAMALEQPSISKHLQVLRDVGLVTVRCDGRHRLYRTNPESLRPLHDWISSFQRYWRNQLSRIKERAENQSSKIHPNSHSRRNHDVQRNGNKN